MSTGSVIFFCALIGLIPAKIASGKGRSFLGYWIFGRLAFIIALPWALLLRTPRCPYCAERIRPEATVCPHCQRDLATA